MILETIISTAAGLAGAAIGGVLSYVTQKQQFRNELLRIREEHKAEFQAEQTALHFLRHATHIERSFETLRKYLGGFEDDELRKILVRAGAIRTFREDGSEWWRLLDRMDEYIERKKAKQE